MTASTSSWSGGKVIPELCRESRTFGPCCGDLLRRPAAILVGDGSFGRVRVERQPVAADADRLAGDVRGRLGGEEHHQRRAVLGHPDRVLAADLGRATSLRPRQLDERRVDRDGRRHLRPCGRDDRVDGDVAAGELERPGARERDDAGLGGGVVRLAEVAELTGWRADDDDAPALALLAHLDRGGSGARERAAQVGLDDEVEVLVGHLPQHLVAQHAGVGDHDVETPELADRTIRPDPAPRRCRRPRRSAATARPPASLICRDGLRGGMPHRGR